MRRVNGDGGQERVDFTLIVVGGKGARFVVHFFPAEDADVGLAHGGQQILVPAAVLVGDEPLGFFLDGIEGFAQGSAVGRGLVVAVFDALQDACNANLEELIEIAGGNGEKLDSLKEGVGGILRLFEDAAVEAEPGFVTAEEKALSALDFFPHWCRDHFIVSSGEVYLIGYRGRRCLNCEESANSRRIWLEGAEAGDLTAIPHSARIG
jgi:hypothetical protein